MAQTMTRRFHAAMINEPLTPEERADQRQTMSFMRNLEAMPADEQRKIRGRIYGWLRDTAALDPDEQPPEIQNIIIEARHLLRPPD